MNLTTLRKSELYNVAERDPRFLKDPLVTELALRLLFLSQNQVHINPVPNYVRHKSDPQN